MLRCLRKFERLNELYFILDEAGVQAGLGEGNGDAEGRSPSVEREVCRSYSRTYFEVDMSAESVGVKVSNRALMRLGSKLVSESPNRRWKLWSKTVADTQSLLLD